MDCENLTVVGHHETGPGNRENIRQATMEGIDVGLHSAVDRQSLSEVN